MKYLFICLLIDCLFLNASKGTTGKEKVDFFVPKLSVKVKSLSRVRLCATPWTVAYKALPSMGFFQARVLDNTTKIKVSPKSCNLVVPERKLVDYVVWSL